MRRVSKRRAPERRERGRRPARLDARPDYARLATERPNPGSRDLDVLRSVEIARLMNREDVRAVRAVGRAAPAIARAVELIVAALGARGRLIFVGAGTSGRLGVLEAAECPPTFGTPPALVQAIMAGGRASVFRSREGAEDDEAAGRWQARRRVRRGDVVVGISASGVTPFVHAALEEARALGARTVVVRCTPQPGRRSGGRDVDASVADVVIAPAPGPEILAGSTRLKAGTATKLVLNTLTTASMVRLGKVYGNRMVDLLPRSRKLQARALRLVEEIAGVPRVRARRALVEAGGRARLAIVIARTGLSVRAARRALDATGGALRPLLDRSPAAQPVRRRNRTAFS
jgi:N-acetylmuramic acid 6-phosphate etherase